MLVGNDDLAALGRRAPKLAGFEGETVTLSGVELLQLTYELGGRPPESFFPPALTPTLPVLAVLSLWRVAEGPLGPFSLAQLRLSCRSGVRPRQLLVASFAEGDSARAVLNERFAFGARPAKVRLERFYDRVDGSVTADGAPVLELEALNPLPLATSDLQFFSSMHPADTPKGLRLVQVDADVNATRAERATPAVTRFVPEAFGVPGGSLAYPVAAFVALGDVTLPKVRFLCRPDVPAFTGTERV